MYGTTLFCKRKVKLASWSAQVYSAFDGESRFPGQGGMRRALAYTWRRDIRILQSALRQGAKVGERQQRCR